MKKITAFGEILFDVYPEKKTLGGAPFNFLYHIKKLSGEGNFISKTGDDDFGKEIHSFLRLHSISSDYVGVDTEHSTGVANANLDENKIPHWEIKLNCAYDFIEPSDKITNLIEDETDCLYFGTLAQRSEISRNTLNKLFGKKIKYFCDLNIRQNFYNAGIIKTSLDNANVLKLNDDELIIVNELFLKKAYDEADLAEQISKIFNIELVCITKGDKGAILYKNGKTDRYKASADIVVDTVGAGDAYASVLCLGYLHGWEISKINRIASEFAAGIVQVRGALPDNESIYTKFREMIKNE